MAQLVDLVKINCASTGSRAITLGTAVAGYRGVERLTNGVTYSYSIQQGSNYEYGRATYLAAGQKLVRSPIDSSIGGAALDLQPNATVSFTALAEDFADLLGAAALTQQVIDTVADQIADVEAAGVAAVDSVDTAETAALAQLSIAVAQVVNLLPASPAIMSPVTGNITGTYDPVSATVTFANGGTAGFSSPSLTAWYAAGDKVTLRVRAPSNAANLAAMKFFAIDASGSVIGSVLNATLDATAGEWRYDDYVIPSNFDHFTANAGPTTGACVVSLPDFYKHRPAVTTDEEAIKFAEMLDEQRLTDALANAFDRVVLADPNVNHPKPALDASGQLVVPAGYTNTATIDFTASPIAAGTHAVYSCTADQIDLDGGAGSPVRFTLTLTFADATTQVLYPVVLFGNHLVWRILATKAITSAQIKFMPLGTVTYAKHFFTVGTWRLASKAVLDPPTARAIAADRVRLTTIEATALLAEAERFKIESLTLGTADLGTMPNFVAHHTDLMVDLSQRANRYYVDQLGGSDSTGTGSRTAPWASVTRAIAAAANGPDTVIYVKTPHVEKMANGIAKNFTTSLVGVGNGVILNDIRMSLVSAPCVLVAGTTNVYEYSATFTDLPPASVLTGFGAGTTYQPAVWTPTDTVARYVVGGASIAANTAAMDALDADQFTMYFAGSTEQDMRKDTAGASTSVKIRVRRKGGGSPAGLAYKSTDYLANWFNRIDGAQVLANYECIGNWNKDAGSCTPVTVNGRVRVPALVNVRARDTQTHGFVGASDSYGKYISNGQTLVGLSGFDAAGRSNGGGGRHLFYASTIDLDYYLQQQWVEVYDDTQGLYCHDAGGGGKIAGVEVGYLKTYNVGSAVNLGGVISDTIIHRLDARRGELGFIGARNLTVRGGYFETSTFAQFGGRNRAFDTFDSTTDVFTHRFENLMLNNLLGRLDTIGAYAALIACETAPAGQMNEARFVGGWDGSDPLRSFHVPADGVALKPVHIILEGFKAGDLREDQNSTRCFASISATAGSRLNFGPCRTVAELRTKFDSLGVIHDLSDDIILAQPRTA